MLNQERTRFQVQLCLPAPPPSHLLPSALASSQLPRSAVPRPNASVAGCTALLIIHFVSKELPVWHICCNCRLACPNQALRKEEEEVLRDAFIFTRLFYRFQVATQCCHGEIVLTAYEKDTQNSGRPAVFSFSAHRDDLHPSLLRFSFHPVSPAFRDICRKCI